MSLVIKKWYAADKADENGNYVHIVGREGGLLSFLLSLMKIDPTSEVQVKDSMIIFTESSFAGKIKRVIPINSISSAFYGYEKPWKQALGITIAGLPIFCIGLIAGPLYYFLNKNLTVAVVEASSWTGAFSFKRSVIEGQNIDEDNANKVIDIIRTKVEAKTAG